MLDVTIRRDPEPARRYARFRPLIAPDARRVDATFVRMAELVAGLPGRAHVQFVLLDGERRRSWCLELRNKACKVKTVRVERPDLEVVTTPEIWGRIAEGELSPIEAFLCGRLTVAGKLELAKLILRRLASDANDLIWVE
jgi:hypothetical protein